MADTASKQRGLYITTAVVLAAMLGMATYTLEGSQLMLSRSKLQFVVDAAALSAAKVLHDTAGDRQLARKRALNGFERSLRSDGNQSLYQAWLDKEFSLKVQFSDQLSGFKASPQSAGSAARFVRIVAVLRKVQAEHSQISAVAGPSAGLDRQLCGVSPILVCGCQPGEEGCDQGSYLGLNYQSEQSGPRSLNRLSSARGLQPGGYQLLAKAAGRGPLGIKRALDSGFNQCLKVGDQVALYRGDRRRPVAASIASRFTPEGVGSAYGVPDLVSRHSNQGAAALLSHRQYRHQTARCMADPAQAGCNARGLPGRREVILPVAQCRATEGYPTDARILGFACAFLRQPAQRSDGDVSIDVELVRGCLGQGGSSVESAAGPLPSKIVLYLDSGRGGAG